MINSFASTPSVRIGIGNFQYEPKKNQKPSLCRIFCSFHAFSIWVFSILADADVNLCLYDLSMTYEHFLSTNKMLIYMKENIWRRDMKILYWLVTHIKGWHPVRFDRKEILVNDMESNMVNLYDACSNWILSGGLHPCWSLELICVGKFWTFLGRS
jgi:hypothetical protein